MALYHTYRPLTFEQMRETQPEVAKFFEEALRRDKLGHIYLLVGSHGTGKTSTARILARAVNCLRQTENPESRTKNKKELIQNIPCNECENCRAILAGSFVDVFELDAASHRGIDDVRALQEVIKLSPVLGKKKVYIIDEVHMLTTEAFNALLKTFEEPPEGRLFVLCTTELHKVPQTIQSRSTIVQFATPADSVIAGYVSRVATGERAEIDPEAALEIARGANGAFRDAAKLTEQLLTQHARLTLGVVQAFLTGSSKVKVDTLLSAVEQSDVSGVSEFVRQLEEQGANVLYVIKASIQEVRARMRANLASGSAIGSDVLLLRALQQAYVETKYAPLPALALEIALLEMMAGAKEPAKVQVAKEKPREQAVAEVAVAKKDEVAVKPIIGATIVPAAEVQMPPADSLPAVEVKIAESEKQAGIPSFEQLRERWREVVALVKDSNESVAAALRMTTPQGVEGKSVVLSTTYKFHKDQLESPKNCKLVEGALYELFGVSMKLQCQLVQQSVKKMDMQNVQAVADEGLVEAALEIFGS